METTFNNTTDLRTALETTFLKIKNGKENYVSIVGEIKVSKYRSKNVLLKTVKNLRKDFDPRKNVNMWFNRFYTSTDNASEEVKELVNTIQKLLTTKSFKFEKTATQIENDRLIQERMERKKREREEMEKKKLISKAMKVAKERGLKISIDSCQNVYVYNPKTGLAESFWDIQSFLDDSDCGTYSLGYGLTVKNDADFQHFIAAASSYTDGAMANGAYAILKTFKNTEIVNKLLDIYENTETYFQNINGNFFFTQEDRFGKYLVSLSDFAKGKTERILSSIEFKEDFAY